MKLSVLILITCSLFHKASPSCTFPSDLEGTWESPDKGTLTINSTTITGYGIDTYTTLVFECEASSGSNYVIRSGNFTILSNEVNAALCLSLTQDSTNKYSYFVLTDELADASYERVRFISSSSATLTTTEICNATYVTSIQQEAKIIVREGFATSVKTQCPDVFLATMYYVNHTTCNESSWDVCTAVTDMTIDYTKCSETQCYSASGYLYCVYGSTSGSTGMAYVYNNDSSVDGSTTYQFTCLMAESSGGLIYMSQHPKGCYRNQTATYAPASGTTMILGTNVTCVPTTAAAEETTASAGLVAGLVVMFLVLIAAGAVVGYIVYTKKFKKVEPEKQRVIDREKSTTTLSISDTHKDTVTPSVVHTTVHSPRNDGGSHGKLDKVLGPEYTMSKRGELNAPEKLDVEEIESPRKLMPLPSTGETPREHMSPLDTQLKKPQLPPIP